MELRAGARDHGTPLVPYWNECVGAGRANEGLRAAWQEHLRMAVRECGFRYVRFHGLFHDDMFVTRTFQYVNELFDRLLDAGIRPFVELGFSPGELARERATTFWWGAHGSPPTDLAAWADLVRRLIRNCVARYGVGEVRQWYFEVWNEPNLYPFFRGTRSEYFELYKVTALAVKEVDPLLRVGGPATSNFVPDGRFAGELEDNSRHAAVTGAADLDALEWRPVWVEEFLDYCHREGLPVDFVSCHPFPTDRALDGHGQGATYTRGASATATDLRTLNAIVEASPYPEAEIHLTEWSSTPSPRDHTHDHLQAATFIVRSVLESIGLADSLAYRTFTDVFEESGAGDTSFHGGFGLINYQGIPKPAFHTYRFLNCLGDTLLARTPGAAVTRRGDRLVALACHYPPEMPSSVPLSAPGRETAERTLALGRPEPLVLELTGLPAGAVFTVETLDTEHGNPLATWAKMGRPEPLSREDAAELRAVAPLREVVHASADGVLRLARPIQPWSVVLVEER
ncbi:GH39 family glycosyl hydrolase [Nonomuraea basaltis]|uniref:GH39 family glycosyl hydrolase n=1 Tax=Nonomuraea basaltis TaxID=2495887 RepID=UPI00110C3EE2|nr:beta-xylosidase [Nonomuraea basaltis]TMR89330.1 beta-xylosidase [Nonomuraea basaltis]